MCDYDEDPKEVVSDLCHHFYSLGWCLGTGGSVTIKDSNLIYVTPAGVARDTITPEDVFVFNSAGDTIVERPANIHLKPPENLPLYLVPFVKRKANCVIHSQSHYANLVTCLDPRAREFTAEQQEIIKALNVGTSEKTHNYYDKVEVPIIEGSVHDKEQLQRDLPLAMLAYSSANACLIRRNGVYVWGKNWKHAKSLAETYEYLFRLTIEDRRLDTVNNYPNTRGRTRMTQGQKKTP